MLPKTLNREISWLHFNARVLQEAEDESNPIIERIKFLGIFSNNQDEFYRVRVATIRRMQNVKTNDSLSFDPNKIMKEILDLTLTQQKRFLKIYKNLRNEMEAHNIFIINETEVNKNQIEFIREYFREKVRPHLFPMMVKKLNEETSLKDKSIYLAVNLACSKDEDLQDQALIKIPNSINRFVVLPPEGNKKFIILLDDVIRLCFDEIFGVIGYDRFKAYTIKFTRDAELDLDMDISKSFMEVMTESLKKRRIGQALRFVYDKEIPEDMLNQITKKLKITKKDIAVQGDRYHNFKDFIGFPNLGSSDMEFDKFQPIQHKDLEYGKSIMKVLRKKDVMLHFPYHSFQHIIDLLREASIDPKVRSIKMTLYRVAPQSKIINALINAARNGKSVSVFMELQARFDEKANIYYAEKLQEEGVKIISAIPGFKVHSKMILIRRRDGRKEEYFANIGTGNFNEKTARIYADDSLLTSNSDICKEVAETFELFEANYKPFRFKTLIVSPFNTRNRMVRYLNREILNAKSGKEAWAIIKLNNIVDDKLVKKLYEAAKQGVKIKLIIRGICVLAPEDISENPNLEIISILDKYLEHSRVIAFCNDGDPAVFITSADWMIRNLDNRIEVTTPIFDKEIKAELLQMLKIQLKDNTKARLLDFYGNNHHKRNQDKQIRAQFETYKYLYKKHQNS